MNSIVTFWTLYLLEVKQLRYSKKTWNGFSDVQVSLTIMVHAISVLFLAAWPTKRISIVRLSCGRSVAYSKLSSPQSAIWCYVFQIPASPFLLTFTQLLLTSSFSSIVIAKIEEWNHSFSLKSVFGFLVLVFIKILMYYSTLLLVLLF